MNIPLIVKFRNQLNARRRSEGVALFIGFSGIIMFFVCYELYRITQRYVSHEMPVNLLILVVVLIWIVSGIPAQVRIVNDQKWMNFISLMPVSSVDMILLHANASLLPTLMVAVCLPCIIAGAGIKIWILSAILRWLLMIVGLIWILFLEIAIAMTMSRYKKGRRFLFGIVICWVVVLAIRVGINFSSGSNSIFQISDVIVSDFGLRMLGVSGLVNALVAPDSTILRIGSIALAHITLAIVVFACYSRQMTMRPAIQSSNSPMAVVLSKPVRFIIKRMVPGQLGGQVCIEWLRTLRSTNEMVIFYVLMILGVVIADRMSIGSSDVSLYALVFGAMALTTDTGISVLANRRGKKLYDIYGINPRHYLLGFISSFGLVMASLCIVQIPIMGNFDRSDVAIIFSGCTATSILLIDMGVVFSRQLQHFGILSKIGIGLSFFIITSIIMELSCYNFILPLIIAGIYLVFEVRNAKRDVVKNLYWDI